MTTQGSLCRFLGTKDYSLRFLCHAVFARFAPGAGENLRHRPRSLLLATQLNAQHLREWLRAALNRRTHSGPQRAFEARVEGCIQPGQHGACKGCSMACRDALRLAQPVGLGNTLKKIARRFLHRLRSFQGAAIHAPVNQRQHQDVQVRRSFIVMHDGRHHVIGAVPLASPPHSSAKKTVLIYARTRRQAGQQLDGLDVIAAQLGQVNARVNHATQRQRLHPRGAVRPSNDDVLGAAAGVNVSARAALFLLRAKVVRYGLPQRRWLAPTAFREPYGADFEQHGFLKHRSTLRRIQRVRGQLFLCRRQGRPARPRKKQQASRCGRRFAGP